jgi:uncharacterized membrane protein YdfJ with MMPL/SSD domain
MQVIKGTRLDAFVDRMALVPAAMTIFGNRAWWLRRFLPPHRAEDDSPARCRWFTRSGRQALKRYAPARAR